jgi:hypothetical protein
VLGDTVPLHPLAPRLESFVTRGGALLIANDRADSTIAKSFGVRFEQGPLIVYPKFAYEGLTDCPIIADFNSVHRLFRGVSRLVANRSGTLSLADSQCAVLASARIREDAPLLPIVAARQSSESRLLLLSDHSLFVNEMMSHQDNAQFVLNCIDWLRQPTRRSKLIFVVDGQPQPPFGLGSRLPPEALKQLLDAALKNLPSVAPPVSDESVRVFVNQLLTSLEDKDAFNIPLVDRPRGMHSAIVRRFAIVLAAITITSLFLVGLVLGHERPRAVPPTKKRWWRRSAPAPAPLEDDYGRWLRVLSREVFDRYRPTAIGAGLDPRCPPLLIKLPLLSRMSVRRQTNWLWRWAFGGATKKLGRRRFHRWFARLQALERLLESQRLRLNDGA